MNKLIQITFDPEIGYVIKKIRYRYNWDLKAWQ